MKGNLYIIGGGTPDDPRMEPHLRRVYELANKHSEEKPSITLLPTAHRNGLHPELLYRDFFRTTFKALGANVTEILLGEVSPNETAHSPEEVADMLGTADALFVLNGDTRHLLQVLEDANLIPVFKKAYEGGLLFSGTSAGCIWIGHGCLSDSEYFENPEQWDYIYLEGLGILPYIINAHDNQGIRSGLASQKERSVCFNELMQKHHEHTGIALDEFAALHIKDGNCSLYGQQDVGGSFVHVEDQIVIRTPMPKQWKLEQTCC